MFKIFCNPPPPVKSATPLNFAEFGAPVYIYVCMYLCKFECMYSADKINLNLLLFYQETTNYSEIVKQFTKNS